MQMDNTEIAIDYRRAANKQKQIKILAELNQCAERRIAEILAAEGEELPKKWQEQLQKPSRRSWKYPEADASRESPVVSRENAEPVEAAVEPEPDAPAAPATDRDLFDAVATLLPDAAPVGADSIRPEPEETAEVPVAPGNADEARHWVDGVGPVPVETPEETATVTLDPSAWDRAVSRKIEPGWISAEDLLREACRMLTSALDLEPDRYYTYSCGVLDLVHALTEE